MFDYFAGADKPRMFFCFALYGWSVLPILFKSVYVGSARRVESARAVDGYPFGHRWLQTKHLCSLRVDPTYS